MLGKRRRHPLKFPHCLAFFRTISGTINLAKFSALFSFFFVLYQKLNKIIFLSVLISYHTRLGQLVMFEKILSCPFLFFLKERDCESWDPLINVLFGHLCRKPCCSRRPTNLDTVWRYEKLVFQAYQCCFRDAQNPNNR